MTAGERCAAEGKHVCSAECQKQETSFGATLRLRAGYTRNTHTHTHQVAAVTLTAHQPSHQPNHCFTTLAAQLKLLFDCSFSLHTHTHMHACTCAHTQLLFHTFCLHNQLWLLRFKQPAACRFYSLGQIACR